MLTTDIVLRSLGALIGSVVLFILIGVLFFRLFRRDTFVNSFERFYWCGTAGLILIVSGYAIYMTGFRTVLLICPVLLVLFVRSMPALKTQTEGSKVKEALLFTSAALVIYFVFYSKAFFSFSHTGMVKFAALDNLYYARLASYLNLTGREVYSPEYLFPQAYTTTPYHYGDMWLCALIANVANLKTPFALILVMYPCLAVFGVLGIAAFIVHRFAFHPSRVFLCLFALFFTGITLLYFIPTNYRNVTIEPIANYPKTLWILVFVIGTLQLTSKREWLLLSIWAALCSITFINALPALMASAVLLLLIQMFAFHQSYKTLLPGIATVIGTGLYIVCFYKITSTPQAALFSTTNGSAALLKALSSSEGTATKIVHVFLQGQLFLPYLLLFAVAGYGRRLSTKKVWAVLLSSECLWLVLLLLSGLVAWLFTRFYTTESPQFLYNIVQPLVATSITAWAYWMFASKNKLMLKVATAGILVFLLFHHRDFTYDLERRRPDEWTALKDFLNRKGNGRKEILVFLHVKPLSAYSNFFRTNTRLYPPLPEITYLMEPYINESLDIPLLLQDSLARQSQDIKAQLRNSSFYQYLQQKKPLPPKDWSASMHDFAIAVHAQYLMVSKQTSFPPVFRPGVVDSIELNNYMLYQLNLK